jgi:hypothetical protein
MANPRVLGLCRLAEEITSRPDLCQRQQQFDVAALKAQRGGDVGMWPIALGSKHQHLWSVQGGVRQSVSV